MEALRAYLDATKIKQAVFARRSGVDPGLLSYYLSGQRRPTIKNLRKLMKATGMSFEDLTRGLE